MSQPSSGRSSALAACAACRRLKMRCIRPPPNESSNGSTEPCERCVRNNRTCTIPEPRPLGRRHGAVGRYKGVEKALRQIQNEIRKSGGQAVGIDVPSLSFIQDLQEDIPSQMPSENTVSHEFEVSVSHDQVETSFPMLQAGQSPIQHRSASLPQQHQSPARLSSLDSRPKTVSAPLGLVADASEAAQALEQQSVASNTPPFSAGESSTAQYATTMNHSSTGLGWYLLRRPGYISLGLSLRPKTLEDGLDALFASSSDQSNQYYNYFKPPVVEAQLDTGPEYDPVDLGLVSMEEAYVLFPFYFRRLHPINGILDPELHTPDFVRSRSALLFTWILAVTTQFDIAHRSMAKRLRLHGEKLSQIVHSRGFKSVDIVQGFYISLLSPTPAATIVEERISMYTTHAFGLAAELNLDQGVPVDRSGATTARYPRSAASPHIGEFTSPAAISPHGQELNDAAEESVLRQRLARNRERTWLRMLLWERANSSASGRMNSFPETELTLHVDTWWMHPLAISTDKYTSAFILLRQRLALIHNELRAARTTPHTNRHWVLEHVDKALLPWCQSWLSLPDDPMYPDYLSNVYLRHVYMHARLWTISFALHDSLNIDQDNDAIKEDCFNAAVNCCEVAVRDLEDIGELLYCIMAPTWAMLCYTAVLALKLFPAVHGSRPGSEVQLLALLAQVALQLERAGTTPSHRFGISALLGQHLMMILRVRASSIKESLKYDANAGLDLTFPGLDTSSMPLNWAPVDINGQLSKPLYPLLSNMAMPGEDDLMGEDFAEILKELFGQGI